VPGTGGRARGPDLRAPAPGARWRGRAAPTPPLLLEAHGPALARAPRHPRGRPLPEGAGSPGDPPQGRAAAAGRGAPCPQGERRALRGRPGPGARGREGPPHPRLLRAAAARPDAPLPDRPHRAPPPPAAGGLTAPCLAPPPAGESAPEGKGSMQVERH